MKQNRPNSNLKSNSPLFNKAVKAELHVHKCSGHTLTKRSNHNGGSDKRGDTLHTDKVKSNNT